MNSHSRLRQELKRWCRRLLALVFAFVVGLAAYVVVTIHSANLHAVVKGQAYRSGQMSAEQLARTVERYGIKSILNLRGENLASDWHQMEIAIAEKLNVIHYDRSLGSGDRLTLEQMDDLVILLRQSPKPVLIHCLGGADRSGLVSALYRFAIEGQKIGEADKEFSI